MIAAAELAFTKHWKSACFIALAILALPLLFTISVYGLKMAGYTLCYNSSGSMPIGFYLMHRIDHVERNEWVMVCLSGPPLDLARSRRYLHPGWCPTGLEPVYKIVGATGGDVVVVDSKGICINGMRLPSSRRYASDKQHLPLPAIAFGTYNISASEVWFETPSPDSWDSRYYGPQPLTNAVGEIWYLGRRAWSIASTTPCSQNANDTHMAQ